MMKKTVHIAAMMLALVLVLVLVGCDKGIAFDALREKYEEAGCVYSVQEPEMDVTLEYGLTKLQEALEASDFECKVHYFSKEGEVGPEDGPQIKVTGWFVILEYDSAKTVKKVTEQTEGVGAILRDQIEKKLPGWNFSYDTMTRDKYIFIPLSCPQGLANGAIEIFQS